MSLDGLGQFIAATAWCCLIFVPLGVWKAAEILWWLVTHISIGVTP
jgi:hypothetical protein